MIQKIGEKRDFIHVTYKEIENLIREVYNRPEYNIFERCDYRNDSAYIYEDVHVYASETGWEESDFDEFRETGKGRCMIEILDDLCTRGIIETGDYIIEVWY